MSGSSGERCAPLRRQSARLPAFQARFERGIELDFHLDVVAQQRDRFIRRGAERHDDEIGARHRFEQFGREVLRAADHDGADIDRAGLVARRLEDIAERVKFRRSRGNGEDQVEMPMVEIGVNCLSGSNGSLLKSGDADRGAVGEERQRIAIGRARDHGARRGDAAGARHVLDDEILAELLAELFGDQPRGDIGDAAGAERNDDAHRMVRISRLAPPRRRH